MILTLLLSLYHSVSEASSQLPKVIETESETSNCFSKPNDRPIKKKKKNTPKTQKQVYVYRMMPSIITD